MAQFKIHKFVSALPAQLEADAVYAVRSDDGFDLYITNSSGTIVAYKVNPPLRGMGGFCSGKPSASETIGAHKFSYAFTIASSRCTATASVAATASTIFTITKDGVSIGTITFAAAATTGTFNFTNTSVVTGNRLIITAPATPDATLADIDFLIRN